MHLLLVSSHATRARTPTSTTTLNSSTATVSKSKQESIQAYVGWTGLAASSSLARFRGSGTGSGSAGGGDSDVLETLEIDPQFAGSLGFHLGDIVRPGLLISRVLVLTVCITRFLVWVISANDEI